MKTKTFTIMFKIQIYSIGLQKKKSIKNLILNINYPIWLMQKKY